MRKEKRVNRVSKQTASHDVLIIGGGPGGYVAAIRAHQRGLNVGLVERADLGGVCLNWGCIPTKALLHSAGLLDEMRNAKQIGVVADNVRGDYAAAQKHSRRAANRLGKGVQFLMRSNKVTVYNGLARITAPGKVHVEGDETQTVEAKNIIIATGGRPRLLPGLEADGKQILTSREALALTKVPKSMVIIGAGAIGVEFASIFNSFGVEVTIVEALPTIVPLEEPEISAELTKIFKKQGMNIITGARVESVDKAKKSVTVNISTGDGDDHKQALKAEQVLVAIGVAGNSENLGLEDVGVNTDRGFIVVDEHMRTNVPGIYAVGDVVGGPQLAHVASEEGIVAVETIAGGDARPIDYDKVPRATYCHPQVAAVGLTEARAKELGYDVKVGTFPLRGNGLAVATGRTDGFVKIVAESKYDEILGMHIIGPQASELIAEQSLGQTIEATVHDVSATIHAHPTLSESVREAAMAVLGEAIHM